MKLLIIIFFSLALYAIFLTLKDDLPPYQTCLIILIIGLNPFFCDFKDQILTDIPFLFFIYLGMWFIRRLKESNNWRYIAKNSFLLGLLIYLMFGMRTIGLIFLLSLVLYNIVIKNKLIIITICSTIIFVLLYFLQKALIFTNINYSEQLSINLYNIIINIYSNLFSYISAFFYFWFFKINFLNLVFIATLLCISIAGFIKKIKHSISFYEVFALLYGLTIIAWPSIQGTRFLMPLFPLFMYYTFYGLNNLAVFQKQVINKIAYGILIVAIGIMYSVRYYQADWGPYKDGVETKEAVDLFNYIKLNTREDDACIFFKPRALTLFTGRHAAVYNKPPVTEQTKAMQYTLMILQIIGNKQGYADNNLSKHEIDRLYEDYYIDLLRFISQINAAYLIIGTMDPYKNTINQFIKMNSNKFILLYHNPGFNIYYIDKNVK